MRTPILLLFAATAALAQSAFVAADVQVSPPGATESRAYLPNGRAEFRATTLLQLISETYSVPPDRIIGGPPWIDTDKFDVTAQGPAHANQLALRTMLQPLLAERFSLAVEKQEKDVPALVFTVARPGSLKPHEPKGAPDCQRKTEDNVATLVCRNMSVANLGERLRLIAPAYFNLPTVDQTGLSGSYDFSFRYTGRGNLAPGTEYTAPLSLFNAIEKTLGVYVERSNVKLSALAITAVNRTPAPNPSGTAEKLGPVPTEFEVAEIRPSRPGQQEDAKLDNGRIDARGIGLRDLIAFAYNVEPDWVRGEKWIETERFDIHAKSALTESDDTFRVMVQNLLVERFHLKVHKESQPVEVYALTAGKPKLKQADPTTRATCRTGVDSGMRFIACQNTTMAQLAEKIRDATQGYIGHPVVDLTDLSGAWDFTVSWTPFARFTRRSSDDATIVLTVFEAVDRQLGLKLATQKYPMPVVVVDHCDRRPTEN